MLRGRIEGRRGETFRFPLRQELMGGMSMMCWLQVCDSNCVAPLGFAAGLELYLRWFGWLCCQRRRCQGCRLRLMFGETRALLKLGERRLLTSLVAFRVEGGDEYTGAVVAVYRDADVKSGVRKRKLCSTFQCFDWLISVQVRELPLPGLTSCDSHSHLR